MCLKCKKFRYLISLVVSMDLYYRPLVIQKMEEMYSTSFRDVTELSQATQFLHENGTLHPLNT